MKTLPQPEGSPKGQQVNKPHSHGQAKGNKAPEKEEGVAFDMATRPVFSCSLTAVETCRSLYMPIFVRLLLRVQKSIRRGCAVSSWM